jgi:hypothetical protein
MHGSTCILSGRHTRWPRQSRRRERKAVKATDKYKTCIVHVSQRGSPRFGETTERRKIFQRLRVNQNIITKYHYIRLDSIVSLFHVTIYDWDHVSQSIVTPETNNLTRQGLQNCRANNDNPLQIFNNRMQCHSWFTCSQKMKRSPRIFYSMLEWKVWLHITPGGVAITKEMDVMHATTLNSLPAILCKSPCMKLPFVETHSKVKKAADFNFKTQGLGQFHNNECSSISSSNSSSSLSNSTIDHPDNIDTADPEELYPPVFTSDLYDCSLTSVSTIEDESVPSNCQYLWQESTTWGQLQHHPIRNHPCRMIPNDSLLVPKASPPVEEIHLFPRRYQLEASMPLISSPTSAFTKICSSSIPCKRSIIKHKSKDFTNMTLPFIATAFTWMTEFNPYYCPLDNKEKTNDLDYEFKKMALTSQSLSNHDKSN